MRILWLKTELLHPIDKGGKIRTYHMLKELKREHEVTYLTLDDGAGGEEAEERADEYCRQLVRIPHQTHPKFSVGFYGELARNLASPLPYFMQKYRSAAMQREIAARVEQEVFDVLVCDFIMPSINMPAQTRCATVLFQHNVEAMIWKRHFEVQTSPVKKAYLYDQWRKTHRFEAAVCRRFDHVVAVSREDREIMRHEYSLGSVSDVPTGVDTAYFRPQGAYRREPHNLVFTGSMDWLPNEDAVRWFIEQVFPRIKVILPEVTLTVVGRNPSARLVALSQHDHSVTVTGRVDDVRPYLERASAFIAPIRIGGGTRLKLYEAMAMEKPVISTTVGAEGLPVRHGMELLQADTPETFAAAVLRVLTQETFARDLGRRAAAVVRAQFGWDRAAEHFAEICRLAAHRRNAPLKVTDMPTEAIHHP